MSLRGLLFRGAKINSTYANSGLLILRVYSGLALASQHGIRKIPPPEIFIHGVGELGFPLPEFFPGWRAVQNSLLESCSRWDYLHVPQLSSS